MEIGYTNSTIAILTIGVQQLKDPDRRVVYPASGWGLEHFHDSKSSVMACTAQVIAVLVWGLSVSKAREIPFRVCS